LFLSVSLALPLKTYIFFSLFSPDAFAANSVWSAAVLPTIYDTNHRLEQVTNIFTSFNRPQILISYASSRITWVTDGILESVGHFSQDAFLPSSEASELELVLNFGLMDLIVSTCFMSL
jgi:hypothetical protein